MKISFPPSSSSLSPLPFLLSPLSQTSASLAHRPLILQDTDHHGLLLPPSLPTLRQRWLLNVKENFERHFKHDGSGTRRSIPRERFWNGSRASWSRATAYFDLYRYMVADPYSSGWRLTSLVGAGERLGELDPSHLSLCLKMNTSISRSLFGFEIADPIVRLEPNPLRTSSSQDVTELSMEAFLAPVIETASFTSNQMINIKPSMAASNQESMNDIQMNEMELDLAEALEEHPSPSPSSPSSDASFCFPMTPASEVTSPSLALKEALSLSKQPHLLQQEAHSFKASSYSTNEELASSTLPKLTLPRTNSSYSSEDESSEKLDNKSKFNSLPSSVISQVKMESLRAVTYQVFVDFALFDQDGTQVSQLALVGNSEMTGNEAIFSFLRQIWENCYLGREGPLEDWLGEANFFELYNLEKDDESWIPSSMLLAEEKLGDRKPHNCYFFLRHVNQLSREEERAQTPFNETPDQSSIASPHLSETFQNSPDSPASTQIPAPLCRHAERLSTLSALLLANISTGDKVGALSVYSDIKREQTQFEAQLSGWWGQQE